MMAAITLPTKMEAFARKVAIDGMGLSEAYRATRDCSRMTGQCINSNAKVLARKPKVRERIAHLREHGLEPGPWRAAYSGQARLLAKFSVTEAQMAEFFGCSKSTFRFWKEQHPEFSESINEGVKMRSRAATPHS